MLRNLSKGAGQGPRLNRSGIKFFEKADVRRTIRFSAERIVNFHQET